MCKWEAVEAKMPQYRTQREKRQLAHRIKMLTFVVMMSALGTTKRHFFLNKNFDHSFFLSFQ